MHHWNRVSIFAFVAALFASPIAAPAQTDLSRFSLSQALPADAFIAVAARSNPEREFLHKNWARVFKALSESGIGQDLWDLCTDMLNDEQLDVAEDVKERVSKIVNEVEWGELFGNDMIYAGRFVQPTPDSPSPYEGILMGRLSAEKAEHNFQGLKKVLQELMKLAEAHGDEPFLTFEVTKKDGVEQATLAIAQVPSMGLCVARWKDVIAISFGGRTLMPECIGLLRGEGGKKGLVQTARFKEALGQLPPAEDSFVFFDFSSMMQKMSGFVHFASQEGRSPVRSDAGSRKAKAKAKSKSKARKDEPSGEQEEVEAEADGEEEEGREEAEEGIAAAKLIGKVFDELCFIEYIAEVEWTDGQRTYKESVTALKPDAKERPLVQAFVSTGDLADFARFIPKECETFSCSAGVNWTRLYRRVRDFVSENVPNGEQIIADFDSMQAEEWEFDIEKDGLSLFKGGFTTLHVGSDWAVLLEVTDEKKAGSQIDRWVELLKERMGAEAGLVITPLKIGEGAAFHQATHPMLMMMGGMAPVWGCAENHLIVASSSKVVEKVLATARGKHANVTRSERFQKEGLAVPASQVRSVSFEDQSKRAEELQGLIGGLSMGLGFAMMGMQDAPPQIRTIFGALPGLLAKLGPVAAKMDFFRSSASQTTFDGKVWRTREVQNYQEPKPDVVKSADEEDAADNGEAKPRKPARRKAADDDEDANNGDE